MGLSPIETVQAINRCWESARVDDMRPHLAPQIYMAFPGFVGGSRGLDAFLDGFRDFVDNSTIVSFAVAEVEEEIVGSTATVTYRFVFRYERSGTSYVGRGRDFWVLQCDGGRLDRDPTGDVGDVRGRGSRLGRASRGHGLVRPAGVNGGM